MVGRTFEEEVAAWSVLASSGGWLSLYSSVNLRTVLLHAYYKSEAQSRLTTKTQHSGAQCPVERTRTQGPLRKKRGGVGEWLVVSVAVSRKVSQLSSFSCLGDGGHFWVGDVGKHHPSFVNRVADAAILVTVPHLVWFAGAGNRNANCTCQACGC